MKYFLLVGLIASFPSFATVCMNDSIFRDLEYHPIYAFLGIISAFMGFYYFITAFLKKDKLSGIGQFIRVLFSSALILAPSYTYYDLSNNHGFSNRDFFEYYGQINNCERFSKFIKDIADMK